MKRTLAKLALIAASALALAACETNPVKPEPAAAIPKSTTDLMLEVRKAELELERTEQMAWIKFAAESGSDLAKGFVMGRAAGKPGASAGGSTTQAVLQAQAQADATALRREEMAAQNNWWTRGLQLFDRAVPVLSMTQGYRLQKRAQEIAADQYKFTVDALGESQRGAYDFTAPIIERGPYYFVLPEGASAVTPAAAE